jgi:hypothetical protein
MKGHGESIDAFKINSPFRNAKRRNEMKIMMLAATLGILLSSDVTVYGQEKPKAEEKADTRKDITPLRVQVVVTENEGEKKISSLPYTLVVNAEAPRGPGAKIRMGLRVPIATGPSQFIYQEIGTNLDCWASKELDGRFALHLSIEKSSVYTSNSGKPATIGGAEVSSTQPVIQQFRSELDALTRDGQTTQITVATDPVSGRVTKAEVTVNVMK